MANRVWMSHGTFVNGRIVKQEHLDWSSIDISTEHDTVYTTLVQWYCKEPTSSFVYLIGRHLGNNNMLDISPKHIAWDTRMSTLGQSPCLLIVSYFTTLQYALFGQDMPMEEKTE